MEKVNNLCEFFEMVDKKHKFLEGLVNKGIVKITELGNCYVLIKSATNPDLRMIMAFSDEFNNTGNLEAMAEVVKLAYSIIKLIFDEDVDISEYKTVFGGRGSLTLKSIIARLYRESKLVPVFKFSVIDYMQPNTNIRTTSVKVTFAYAYVPDSRKLRTKVSNYTYAPQVDDKIIYMFTSEMMSFNNSIQKVYSMRMSVSLPEFITFIKNNNANTKTGLIQSVQLLKVIGEVLTDRAKFPILPVDYTEKSVGKPFVSLMSHSVIVINTFISYPRVIASLVKKGITITGYTFEYRGIKGVFRVWVGTDKSLGINESRTISSKHVNLEGNTINSVLAKLVPEYIKLITVLAKD